VENTAMLRVLASRHGGRLSIALGDRRADDVPQPTREIRKVDYWGRVAEVELLDGPFAGLLSEHVGYDVALARPVHAGDVVYGGSVSLVTTSSLHRLSALAGHPGQGARFRPTFVVDTTGERPHLEDGWVGRAIALGSAVVRVRGVIPRCAVVDLDPVSGLRDVPVLATLAGYRRVQGEVLFGVDADVVRPGRVGPGDQVVAGRTE